MGGFRNGYWINIFKIFIGLMTERYIDMGILVEGKIDRSTSNLQERLLPKLGNFYILRDFHSFKLKVSIRLKISQRE